MKLFFSVFVFLSFASASVAADYFCFLPGAGGITSYVQNEVSDELNRKGIPFIAFDVGDTGTVQERSKRFLDTFAKVIRQDAHAKCHIFGFSMGGLMSRWSANHGMVRGPNGPEPMQGRILTQTSASTPHKGTPLAKILRKFWSTAAPGVEQLSEENVKQFNDPQSESYSPVVPGIPFYSYRTYIDSKDEAGNVLELIGYQLIAQEREKEERSILNDGIVPTDAQDFGKHLGDIHAAHGFFHTPTEFSAHIVDFLEAHWDFLTKGTEPLIFD